MNHVLMFAAGGGGLSGLATSTTGILLKIGGAFLIVIVGYKGLGYVAQDRMGAAVGLVVIAIIPAIFLFDPTGATSLLTSAAKQIGG